MKINLRQNIQYAYFSKDFNKIHTDKLYSEKSRQIINFGIIFNVCITNSEPIEPPAPEIRIVLSEINN